MPEIAQINNAAIEETVVKTLKERLLSKKITSSVTFMGEPITINKLSVGEIIAVQESASEIPKLPELEVGKEGEIRQSEANANKEGLMQGLETTRRVVRLGCPDLATFTDAEFSLLPLDELLKLGTDIMAFSGVLTAAGKTEGK